MNRTEKPQKNLEWQIPGQVGAKLLLGNFLDLAKGEQSRLVLPHAYLFLGPKYTGKSDLAKEFADKLKTVLAQSSELFEYDFSQSADLDELRELIKLSSLKSTSGGKIIYLLSNLEQASLNAHNLLLKTLEEPATDSIFILVSNSNNSLPTIMSRCILVRCYPVHQPNQNGQEESLFDGLSSYSGLSKKYAGQDGQLQKFSDLLGKLDTELTISKLPVISELAELDNDELSDLVHLWILKQVAKLSSGQQLSKHTQRISAGQNALADLSKNFNTKLVLQEFLIKI